jgi:hypothetical protein
LHLYQDSKKRSFSPAIIFIPTNDGVDGTRAAQHERGEACLRELD